MALKRKKMLVKAGSNPKHKKLSFSMEVEITNVNSNVYFGFSNEDKVTIFYESELKLIINTIIINACLLLYTILIQIFNLLTYMCLHYKSYITHAINIRNADTIKMCISECNN